MLKFEIFLFGNFQIHFDGTDTTDSLRTRKERALLAYLAEEPSILQTREKVAEFFWPNRPENYARMSLRQALLGLRKTIEGENQSLKFLEISDETIEFNHQHVWVDTKTFSNLHQVVKNHPHHELHTCQKCMEKLESSVELYRGDFLTDLFLNGLTSFQEWVILQRERHFRNYLEVLKTLSKSYYYQANIERSYKYAFAYVEMAPLEEDAHRLLMRLLSLTGRRTAALQQYQMCKAIIKRELGIEPSLETQQLNERIQTNSPIDRIETGLLTPKLQSDSEINQIEATASHLYEPLTNIPLRVIFMDRLRHAITRTRRNQTNIAIVVLSTTFPTQPFFKPDQKRQLETLIIRRLIGSVREDDTIARIQENVYGIILEDIKDTEKIPTIIEKIRFSLSAPVQIQDMSIKALIAIGWSSIPQDGFDPHEVLAKTEIAMRSEKIQKSLQSKH